MKKFYALVVCMLVASLCFAQGIAPKQAQGVAKKQVNGFDNKKIKATTFNVKSLTKDGYQDYIFYYDEMLNYYALDPDNDLKSALMTWDTNGVFGPDTAHWHTNIHGACQTFDFLGGTKSFSDGTELNMRNVYENGREPGELSLLNTPSLNLDSIIIFGGYFRGANVDPDMRDTLLIGVYTDVTDFTGVIVNMGDDQNPNWVSLLNYYSQYYDANTNLFAGARVFKFPLGPENVSPESEDGEGYYTAKMRFPIDMHDITGKVWNISYAFKHGYEVGLNDVLYDDNNTYFSAWFTTDPRPGYVPFDDDDNIVVFEEHLNNANMAGICDDDVRYERTSGVWEGIYNPAPFYYSLHYPYMGLVVSCSECEFVGVEEMEKTNISVYPNPAQGYFKVELANDTKANIQLFNLVGQQVYSETANNTTTISTSNLTSGIYMLKVTQDGKVYTSKVVVR